MYKQAIITSLKITILLLATSVVVGQNEVTIKAGALLSSIQSHAQGVQKIQFTKGVYFQHKEVTINSESLKINKLGKGITLASAQGNAKLKHVMSEIVAQKLNLPKNAKLTAQASNINYYPLSQRVILSGDALLEWQGGIIKSERIEFDLARYEVLSSSPNSEEKPSSLLNYLNKQRTPFHPRVPFRPQVLFRPTVQAAQLVQKRRKL